MDVKNGFSPLYEFGHGLSYTQFEYSNLTLATHQVFQKQSAYGSVTVRNVGSSEGQEVVMVYLNDDYASLTRPKKQLKFFKKVNIKPNEAVTVHFEISHYDMSFIDMDNKRIVEPGRFNIYVQNLNVSFFLKSNSYDAGMPYFETRKKTVVKNSGSILMPAKFVVLCVLLVMIAGTQKIY
jgi:beta-glucosidase